MSAYNFGMYLILIIVGPFSGLCHVFLRRHVGQSATLHCNCQDDNIVMCYWYKQANGHRPVKIISYNKFNSKGEFTQTFKINPRFKINNANYSCNLEIKDLKRSDAATYFCMSSNLYNLNFLETITLDVEGAMFYLTTSVELAPENSSIQIGLATLNCTFDNGICNGGDKVYWYSPSEESTKGVFYSHRDSNDQCESNTESLTNSCVYNLPISDGNATRDWTKCAVALCGKLLFGTKSKLDSEDKDGASVVYLLTAALLVTLIVSLLLALAIYKIKKKLPPAVTIESEDDIHYAALRHHTSNRVRGRVASTNTECVYSGVRM